MTQNHGWVHNDTAVPITLPAVTRRYVTQKLAERMPIARRQGKRVRFVPTKAFVPLRLSCCVPAEPGSVGPRGNAVLSVLGTIALQHRVWMLLVRSKA
jgi:hypothetical protein